MTHNALRLELQLVFYKPRAIAAQTPALVTIAHALYHKPRFRVVEGL